MKIRWREEGGGGSETAEYVQRDKEERAKGTDEFFGKVDVNL